MRLPDKKTQLFLDQWNERNELLRRARSYYNFIAGARAGRLRRSRLLDYYAEHVALGPAVADSQERIIKFPKVFSFIDDPEGALAVLNEFVDVVRANPSRVTVDQTACEQLDVCAGSVLNEFATETKSRIGTSFRGFKPDSEEATEIVDAVGLPALFGITKAGSHFLLFSPQRGPKNISKLQVTSSKGLASTLLAEYVARCFRKVGYELRREAIGRIGDLTGEVLGNVEDHAPDQSWRLFAYMRKPTSKPYGDCHITIFNFGPTIAETIQQMRASDLRMAIEELIDLHRARNFFGMFSSRWTEEELWTLYALQEGITRFYAAPGEHHGIGTADMIEAFNRLGRTIGGEQPRMCLVSGRTHITFDGRHEIQAVIDANNVRRRQIAFNAPNSLELPPDEGTVRHLRRYFPGTLISLRFYMHEPYLIRLAD